MANTYSAAQIVGKNLIARKLVNLYRLPDDKAKPIFQVKAGENVGVVFSYLDKSVSQNRSGLYWVFNDQNGKQYYAKHNAGDFDIKALKDQGVLTVKETTDADKDKTADDYIMKYGVPLAIGLGVIYLLGVVIKTKL